MATPVYLEVAKTRTFACSLDWPGWCRAAKSDEAAPEALAAYADRYRPVAEEAGLELGGGDVVDHDVVESALYDALTEQHDRCRGRAVAQIGTAQRQRVEDQSVEHRGPVAAHHQLLLAHRIAVGLVHHDRVPGGRGLLDHGPGQLGEVRHVELRQDQCDQP